MRTPRSRAPKFASPQIRRVVRSEYYGKMFGTGMKERDAAEITVPKTDLASFTAFIDYLCTDQLDLGEGGEQARRALVLRELAQMYQVPRLELLCAQALQERGRRALCRCSRRRTQRATGGSSRSAAATWPNTPPRCGRAAAWSSCATWAWQGAARRRARPGGGAQGDGGGAQVGSARRAASAATAPSAGRESFFDLGF